MTVTQTVEIPDNRRLIIDVPREVPTGSTVLAFTAPAKRPRTTETEEIEIININAERLNKQAMDTFLFLEDAIEDV